MLDFIAKIPLYRSFRRIGYPKMMPMEIAFTTTYRCNSKCKTCNIWKIKHYGDELELWEYEKIFHSIGKLLWATLGGGEPFLRRDFTEIVIKLIEICKPEVITIPTNGSLHQTISKCIKKILRFSDKTKIILNISLDDIGVNHDNIRGFPKNFELITQTVKRLKNINDKNFTLGIHTTVSKYNINRFQDIFNFVEENIKPDSFIIETAQKRSEFFNLDSDICSDNKKIISVLDFFGKKLKQRSCYGIPKLIKSFRVVYYDNVKKLITSQKKLACYSHFASSHIKPYGDVWACAVRGDVVGNLRDFNYDFRKLWFSKKSEAIREQIKRRGCSCSLANVSYVNILMNFNHMSKVLWYYLTT
jgi:MoaA/NifB/PqqE/SkfB family radical SAM enzyme